MNAKLDMWTWKEIVRQCQDRSFGSINIASKVRSDAIIAANELVELVTPELAGLLESLADMALQIVLETEAAYDIGHPLAIRRSKHVDDARALVARIREALGQEVIE